MCVCVCVCAFGAVDGHSALGLRAPHITLAQQRHTVTSLPLPNPQPPKYLAHTNTHTRMHAVAGSRADRGRQAPLPVHAVPGHPRALAGAVPGAAAAGREC